MFDFDIDPMDEIDVHAVPHPYVTSDVATHHEVHGSLAQLGLVRQLITELADDVIAVRDIQPCTEPNADGCHRLHVVSLGSLASVEILIAYKAAIAICN